MAVAAVAIALLVLARHRSDLDSVTVLDRGDCVDAAAFLEGEQPALDDLTRADCEDPHDAEVLAVLDLSAAQAAAYRPAVPDAVCVDALDDAAGRAVAAQRLLVAGLADDHRVKAGDELACFGFAANGKRLDGRLITR